MKLCVIRIYVDIEEAIVTIAKIEKVGKPWGDSV
jgi:hypothetical protein